MKYVRRCIHCGYRCYRATEICPGCGKFPHPSEVVTQISTGTIFRNDLHAQAEARKILRAYKGG